MQLLLKAIGILLLIAPVYNTLVDLHIRNVYFSNKDNVCQVSFDNGDWILLKVSFDGKNKTYRAFGMTVCDNDYNVP